MRGQPDANLEKSISQPKVSSTMIEPSLDHSVPEEDVVVLNSVSAIQSPQVPLVLVTL